MTKTRESSWGEHGNRRVLWLASIFCAGIGSAALGCGSSNQTGTTARGSGGSAGIAGVSGSGATGNVAAVGGMGGTAAQAGNGGSGNTVAQGGNPSTGGVPPITLDGGPPPPVTAGPDTDGDSIPDSQEGYCNGDGDGDGIPNLTDPINDGDPPQLTLIQISTQFNNPIGIDYHEPTNTVIVSVNYDPRNGGFPYNFERIEFDGSHRQFSDVSGMNEEVKIATARSGNIGGFSSGELFAGNGVDGQIMRIGADGLTVTNPWVDLPGGSGPRGTNGLMRGSLYVDRTGVFNGDLLAVTTIGEVWRVNSAGTPTLVATVATQNKGVHLEGLIVVPNNPARYGPLAGHAIAGAEEQGLLYSFAPDGTIDSYSLGVNIEDIDRIDPGANFFGVNYGTSKILGAGPEQFCAMVGDILLLQEHFDPTRLSGIFRLKWDGSQLVAQPIVLTPQSAPVKDWEHATFASAGIVELPPVPVVY